MYIDHGCMYPEKEMGRGNFTEVEYSKNGMAKKYASNHIFLQPMNAQMRTDQKKIF